MRTCFVKRGEAMNSPTLSMHATQAGVVLGTAAYMSPEQARGKVVDRRADIWAFGVVLYEMLTGQRPFKGDDVTDTLASVLKDTPAFDVLPASTPPQVRWVVERSSSAILRRGFETSAKHASNSQRSPATPAPAHGRRRGSRVERLSMTRVRRLKQNWREHADASWRVVRYRF